MRSFISWLLGFLLGSSLGAALMIFFAPMSGEAFINRLKAHYESALDEGHLASETKRAELEEQLRKLRQARGLNPKA